MIHYFIYGPNIAAVEDAGQAQRYADAGWERVEYAEWYAAWQARDVAQGDAIRAADEQEREWAQLRRIVGRTPGVVYPTRETGL